MTLRQRIAFILVSLAAVCAVFLDLFYWRPL